MRQKFCGGIAADSWITSELLKNARRDCNRQNYMSTSKVYINYTYRKMLSCDLQYPSSCLLFFFLLLLCSTDGLVMIGHRWGFRGNIKHPTQCWICPGFDSRAEIISTVYCLPLPFDVRLTNACEEPGHEAMSVRRRSHGKGAKRLYRRL